MAMSSMCTLLSDRLARTRAHRTSLCSFGFKDGISNPSIDGVDDQDLSGEGKIDPG